VPSIFESLTLQLGGRERIAGNGCSIVDVEAKGGSDGLEVSGDEPTRAG